MYRSSTGFRTVLIFLLFALVAPAYAQEQRSEPLPVHWAYASIFGTGWYEVDSTRSVFILDVPFRHVFSESAIAEDGERQIGWEFHYPVTLGLHQIDDLPGILDPENFGSINVMPGVEMEIPVSEGWRLRPYIKAGMGFDLASSENAVIYTTGLKSRYQMFTEQVVWGLLANVNFSGFNSNKDDSGNISGGLIGVEASHQWPWSKKAYDTFWHLTYTRLHNGPEYTRDSEDGNLLRNVDNVFELGLAFSPSGGRYKLWLYQPERLGLALQMSPKGDYFAIRLNTRSWFTR